MKAKLFTLLLIVALLVCVCAFTAEAAVTLPTQCSVNLGAHTLSLADGKADCPACGTTGATWKALPANATGATVTLESGHYYLDPNVDYTKNNYHYVNVGSTGQKICIHLNGQNLTTSRGVLYASYNAVWRFMGAGTVTSTASNANKGGLVWMDSAEVHIQGGTWTYDRSGSHSYAAFHNNAAASKLFLYNGAIIEKCGPSTTGSGKSYNGGAILIANGTFTMYGGIIRDNYGNYGGSSVYVRQGSGNATFTMYGGTISGGNSSGNQANGNGGNVRLHGVSATARAKFVMYGGTIENGTAFGSGGGGNIACSQYGDITIEGGTISGGQTTGTGHGGNIYGTPTTTITVNGGEIKNGTTKNSGGNVAIEGTMTINGGTFTGGAAATSAPGATTMQTTGGGSIRVTLGATLTMNGGTIHGGTVSGTSDTVGKGGGAVCVTGTFTMNGGTIKAGNGGYGGGAVLVGGTKDSTIATFTMNGGTIDATTVTGTIRGGAVFVAGSKGAQFTMGMEKPEGGYAQDYVAPVIIGGTVTNGGAVFVDVSNFTMNCGTINGGTAGNGTVASTGGGAIYVANEGTVELKGGLISGGSSNTSGGAVYMASGAITMEEGVTISGGACTSTTLAASGGGNVYVSSGTFTMNGGTITGGTSTYNSTSSGGGNGGGGNVAMNSGSFVMNDGIITLGKNLATSNQGHGGNVAVWGGTFTMNDGEITNGDVSASAKSAGGNVYTYNAGKFVMNDGLISGGKVGTKHGANFYARGGSASSSATITLNGGEVVGSSTLKGGNIQLFYYGKLIVDGATIRDGYTEERGGNVVVNNSTGCVIELKSGAIKNGSAGMSGGNIMVWGASATNFAKLIITGGEISGGVVRYDATSATTLQTAGTNARNGGNIHIYGNGVEMEMTDGKIYGGSAANGGNIYITVANSATTKVTLSGGEIYGGTVPTTNNYTDKATYGYGGNIHMVAGELNISGTAKIYQTTTGKAQANHGGNLSGYGGTITISGGEIYGGIAKVGGNIHQDGATITISDGTINDGSARYCDTTSGKAEMVNGARNCGGNIYSSAALTITGGTISGGYAGSWGGQVYTDSGMTVSGEAKMLNQNYGYKGGLVYVAGGTVNINGGTFTANAKSVSGGGGSSFYVGGGTLNVAGGTIENGNSGSSAGGNIRVEGGKFYMTGGTVQNGIGVSGGNIAVIRTAETKLTGGTIQNGVASYDDGQGKTKSYGGNIYIYGESSKTSTVEIGGTVQILNGKVTAYCGSSLGGNIHIFNKYCTVTMTGGKVAYGLVEAAPVAEGGTATQSNNGGNICIGDGATFTMSGGTIANGKITSGNGHGGNVYPIGTFNFTGGEIYGGKCTGYGGNIGMVGNNCAVNISGTAVLNGAAVEDVAAKDDYGGANNLLVYAGTATITGGEIINGNDAGGYSVQIRTENGTVVLGGNAKIDQLGMYGNAITGSSNRLNFADGLTLKADFTGTVHLRWHDVLVATAESTNRIHANLNYGSILGAPVAVEEGYANTGSIWTKSMPVAYGDADGNGAKELYIANLTKVVGTEEFEGVTTDRVIGITDLSEMDEGDLLRVYGDASKPVSVTEDLTVDTNGGMLTVNAPAGTTITIYESQNNSFATTNLGKVYVTGGADVETYVTNPETGYSYIILQDKADGAYTAHRIHAKLHQVSIRPREVGVYYSVEITCDAILEKLVTNYGVAVSLKSMPDDSFLGLNPRQDILFTYLSNNGDFASGQYHGALLKGIMTTGEIADGQPTNADRAAMPVYANAYVVLAGDGLTEDVILMADEDNMGKTTTDADWNAETGIAMSLTEIMTKVNEDANFGKLTDQAKASVQKFYNTWKEAAAWSFNTIETWVKSEEE